MRTAHTSSSAAVHERRETHVAAPPSVVWGYVADLGGPHGWYAANTLWRLRFALDRAIGGPGRRPRPQRPLRLGDPVDGWVVSGLEPGRRLTLTSWQRLPGTAVLTYEVLPDPDGGPGCRLVQHLLWRPHGLRGRLLWAAELPAHVLVMRAMLRGTAREARRRAAPEGRV